jgi:hypothetical protein
MLKIRKVKYIFCNIQKKLYLCIPIFMEHKNWNIKIGIKENEYGT